MKRDKLIYWMGMGLLTFSFAVAGFAYLPDYRIADESLTPTGFPGCCRMQLGIAKIVTFFELVLSAFSFNKRNSNALRNR